MYDTEHLDLTGSAAAHQAGSSQGANPRPRGHGDDLQHRGVGNGVVTGAGNSTPYTPLPFNQSCSVSRDDGRLNLSHALPPVDFTDFDGSTPKLWFKNCQSYFDISEGENCLYASHW